MAVATHKNTPLCTFLQFYTDLEANSARSFQTVCFKSVLWLWILCFFNCIYDECTCSHFYPIGPPLIYMEGFASVWVVIEQHQTPCMMYDSSHSTYAKS